MKIRGILVVIAIGAAAAVALWMRQAAPEAPPARRDLPQPPSAIVIHPGAMTAAQRIEDASTKSGAGFPPRGITLLIFKQERTLEVWGSREKGWSKIAQYRILAASGTAGPKLKQGDLQVPEGIYRVCYLNPHSSYHLSMKIDYPNAFDRAMARKDGRSDLGGDICIHGKDVSIGCIAIGDPAIEELYHLVSRAGKERVKVLIMPNDLRQAPAGTPGSSSPSWLPTLYESLRRELNVFPLTDGGTSSGR